MCEITNENFNKKYAEIETTFKSAKFFSIDLEFSALTPYENYIPSLFDTPKERYNKLCKNLEHVAPLQIGITAFNFDANFNTYTGQIFTFYVQPATFQYVNRSFLFHTDSINFLKTYMFDFNKFFYFGIPYINRDQEIELRHRINHNELSEIHASITTKLENAFQNEFELVRTWHNTAVTGDVYKLPYSSRNRNDNIEKLYFLHNKLRNNFKNIWTNIIDNKEILIRKVTDQELKKLQKNNKDSLVEQLIDDLLGFTRVFRLLVELRKPIIGHNLLQDILLMLINFETKKLPNSYNEFKRVVLKLFPVIFDTKFLTYNFRNEIPDEKRWIDNGLDQLYEYFHNGIGRHLVKNSPDIELIMVNDVENIYGKYHDAGWDSFCAGYIFIRLAYFNVYRKFPASKSFVSTELVAGLLHLKNQVNVIRSRVSSINLDGADPVSTRPPYLVIETIKKGRLDILQVTAMLSNFGYVEVRKCQDQRAILAVDNVGNARRILNYFKTHNEYRVSQYNILKHSTTLRLSILCGLTFSGTAIVLWMFKDTFTQQMMK